MVCNHAVLEIRPFLVDRPRSGLDPLACDFTDLDESHAKILHGFLVIGWRVREFLREFVAMFPQRHDILKINIVESELQVRIVCEKIGHFTSPNYTRPGSFVLAFQVFAS